MLFLLLQITHASPIGTEKIGITTPFTNYVKFLPREILLPSFYSTAELDLALGTSLKDAVNQKIASLEKEFEFLRESTQDIAWCQRHWWDPETGHLTLDDWKQVDAMYRSRALELPGFGDAMAPLIDMANHAAETKCMARFEVMSDSSVLLVLRDGKMVERDDEITIMYGAGGACEMIFSYGFLEAGATSARELFLDLEIPSDDPLRLAKKAMAREAPGVRLYISQDGTISWESSFVWWICVNEEDGLDFQVLQKTDGTRELAVTWNGKGLDPDGLQFTLSSGEMAEVFELRAVVTIQQRLEQQGAILQGSEEAYERALGQQYVRDEVWETIGRLRTLELDLLSSAFEALEDQVCACSFDTATISVNLAEARYRGQQADYLVPMQKTRLMSTPSVQKYLALGVPEDDFS